MNAPTHPPRSFRVEPGGRLSGRLRVPGDKSISHRSVILGALADGVTRVTGFLEGADALSTRDALRALGAHIEGPDHGVLRIQGVGVDGLRAAPGAIDCGNAGTAMRLLIGLLSGQPFASVLVGDESLTRRPMRRVVDPLALMGARIETRDGCPPVHVFAAPGGLRAIRYEMAIASAQVKSALLLAGLYAAGTTEVREPAPTRDHTERMLGGFGVRIARDGPWARLDGGQRLRATDIDVPGDISSAAFFLVGASIAEGSDLTLEHVGVNPTRTGVLDILRAMGADITLEREREVGGEPVADLRVRGARLRGIEVPPEWVPLAIDEFPAIFVAAACAHGRTVVTGAEELRVKESDRIAAMAEGLCALGADARATADGMVIEGRGDEHTPFRGARLASRGDHRIAMALSLAALRCTGEITVDDTANVATSFPDFVALARRSGLGVSEIGSA